jgi:hypothetical protein
MTIISAYKLKGFLMSGLLCLEKDMHIAIKGIDDEESLLCRCEDVIWYENEHNYNCSRYILSSDESSSLYILDVQKTYNKDIKLTCYRLLEEMEFDLNFLSLVGTSPLGYHRPDMKNIDYILYDLIKKENSDIDSIKFLVTKDELPDNPEEKGYAQDGNSNWYFMANRTKGSMLKFSDDYKLSWEYKQEENERLLIEMIAQKGMQDYIKNEPSIYVYDGKALKRKDIKILTDEKIEHFA